MASRKSAPPSATDRTLLDAAFICDLIKVRQALADGANPNTRDEDERTPLFSAVLGGSIGLMGLLLEAGADVNARDSHGFTPLHFAAQELLPEMARLLIAKGADVNATDEDGSSVLWRAIFSAHDRHSLNNEVVAELLAAGAKPDQANKAGETPRALAARMGNPAFTSN
jgi:ankyrin repeat protein